MNHDKESEKYKEFVRALYLLNGSQREKGKMYPLILLRAIHGGYINFNDPFELQKKLAQYRLLSPSGDTEYTIINNKLSHEQWIMYKKNLELELQKLAALLPDGQHPSLEEVKTGIQSCDAYMRTRKTEVKKDREIEIVSAFGLNYSRMLTSLETTQENVNDFVRAGMGIATSYCLHRTGLTKYLPWAFLMGNAVLQGYEALTRKKNIKEMESNPPLAKDWVESLSQEDAAIDRHLSILLHQALAWEEGENKISIRLAQTKKDPVTARSIAKINQSIADYRKRTIEKGIFLTSPAAIFVLRDELEQQVEELRLTLKGEQSRILKMANREKEKANERLVDFDTLLEQFLKGKASTPMQQFLYRYLLWSTRLQQMERGVALCKRWFDLSASERLGIEGKIVLRALRDEMRSKRVYRFDQNTKLLRGYLLFEYKTGKMLWVKQVRQLEKMILSPKQKQVVELIMGSGKTYFIIPTTDYSIANGEKLVVNIWPTSMLKTNVGQISGQSSTIYGQDTYSVSFRAAQNIT